MVRANPETSPRYGYPPDKRPIQYHIRKGIVVVDKPKGPSSREIAAWTKKILGLTRAGHGGTLDPQVTGVLPIALEDATSIVGALLLAGKEYVCAMRLHRDVPPESVERIFQEYTGTIIQTPPMKSAVKRQPRHRRIYYLELLEMDSRVILFKVGCQAGTYIRKLCHDIGKSLGCGAQMVELRRTMTGPLTEEKTTTLHDLVDAIHFWRENGDEEEIRRVVLPLEEGVSHLPKVLVRDSAVDALCHGAQLAAKGVVRVQQGISPGDLVAVMTQKFELIALGKAKATSKQMCTLGSGIVVETKRVVMERGLYPKMWGEHRKNLG